MEEIIEGLMRAAGGDFSAQVELSEDNDIFDSIAIGFNMMADDLKVLTNELTRTNQTLRQEIAERKKAEKAQRSSERKYRQLFDNASENIAMVDQEGTFILMNNAMAKSLGGTPGEFSGKTIQYVFPKNVADERMLEISKVFETGKADVSEAMIPLHDGEHCFQTSRQPVRNESGDITGVLILASDITEEKQAKEQQKKLQEQLNQSQKMEAIGRLAGGVAHDFNNVLCVITGNAALTLKDPSVGEPLRKSIEEISVAADRAADLTRQLLTFSRKQVIAPKVIDLSQLVESMHPMLLRLIGEDIILKTLPKEQLGRVRIDPSQVQQIVLNLAINARDAMPDGGELFIETADIRLDENYCEKHANVTPGSYVMLAVSDTGIGMDSETQSMIFEPFFTTKEQGHGTGLGLATVFGIVEQNGGRVEVYSEPEEGTSFKLYFPSVDEPAESLIPPPVPEAPAGKETVLVVEDEDMVRRMAMRLLKSLGYTVLAVGSGKEALALAKSHEGPIDLLLTDVVMPRMNGRELATKITKIRPEIKVLYASGYTKNVIARHGVLDEGVQFVSKPYTLEMIGVRVRDVLDEDESKKA